MPTRPALSRGLAALLPLAGGALLCTLAACGATQSRGTVPPPPVYETAVEVPAAPGPKTEPAPAAAAPAAPAAVVVTTQIPRLAAGAAQGKPPAFVKTARGAYWLWVNKKGSWQIYTTAARGPHRFQGVITGLEGPLTAFKPTYLGWKDKVKVDGKTVRFDFETKGRADGFTWRMASGCARFELLFDGKGHPERIHVGKGGISPPSNAFEVCQ